MDDIICPHCNKAFKIDQKGYSDILNQVYDKEFERKLDERLIFAEKEKKMEMNLLKKRLREKIFDIQALKEKEIDELKFNMKEAENSKKHAINDAVKTIEIERDKLKNELNNSELIRINSENSLKDKYKSEIRHKDEQINKLREETIQ